MLRPEESHAESFFFGKADTGKLGVRSGEGEVAEKADVISADAEQKVASPLVAAFDDEEIIAVSTRGWSDEVMRAVEGQVAPDKELLALRQSVEKMGQPFRYERCHRRAAALHGGRVKE